MLPLINTSAQTWCPPLKKLTVTSGFGYRVHPITGLWKLHIGVDLRVDLDTAFAIGNGIVSLIGYNTTSGIYMRIDHGAGIQSSYSHLSNLLIWPGAEVHANMPIAISGATGLVTGPHLHFTISYQGRYIDPLKFLTQLIKSNDTTNF